MIKSRGYTTEVSAAIRLMFLQPKALTKRFKLINLLGKAKKDLITCRLLLLSEMC